MVKRITITLDDSIHAALHVWASDEARSVPNLIAYLALKSVKERQADEPASNTAKAK